MGTQGPARLTGYPRDEVERVLADLAADDVVGRADGGRWALTRTGRALRAMLHTGRDLSD